MNKQEAKKRLLDELDHLKIGPVSYANFKIAIWHMLNAIDDHPKVKLPREVGEELDAWKRKWGIDVGEYLTSVCTSDADTPKAQEWREAGYGRARSNQLADAYRYGWEAEPEAKWYVQTPKEWWAQPDAPEYMSLDQLGVVSGIGSKKLADKFTRSELKHYHLDSDIFTLVPAGVEHD